MECVMHVVTLLGEGVGGGYLSLPTVKVDKKDDASIKLNSRGQRRWWQKKEATDEKRWRNRRTGAVAQGEAEAATQQPIRADNKRQCQDNRRRRQCDKMICNNQPGRMRETTTP
jgi:hypothetical protein